MNAMLAILGMGGTELVVVFVAVLLLFGPKKLPELARGLGKGIREFKKASSEVTDELHRAIEEPPAPPKKLPPPLQTKPQICSAVFIEPRDLMVCRLTIR